MGKEGRVVEGGGGMLDLSESRQGGHMDFAMYLGASTISIHSPRDHVACEYVLLLKY